MSFIQTTIKCAECGHLMNVAFGFVGSQQMWGWPSQCPRCKCTKLEEVCDGWFADKDGRQRSDKLTWDDF